MVLTCVVAGALEMILAEEDCYPQFHSKYFMSESHLLFKDTCARFKDAKRDFVEVDAVHQEGVEQVQDMQGRGSAPIKRNPQHFVQERGGKKKDKFKRSRASKLQFSGLGPCSLTSHSNIDTG